MKPQRKILYSPATDILLVYGTEIDINRVKVQLECLASWMGKPVHLQCTRPSGKELRKFGVVGVVQPPTSPLREIFTPKGDHALYIPFFSGNSPLQVKMRFPLVNGYLLYGELN